MGFYLSVLNREYNFVWVCQQGFAWTIDLRWLNTVFQGQHLPSLSINYVAIKKDLENMPPQLY